jgi:hypothetical protein
LESLLIRVIRQNSVAGGEASFAQDRVQPDGCQTHAAILEEGQTASAQIFQPFDPAVLMHQQDILFSDPPIVRAADERAGAQVLAQLPVFVGVQRDGIDALAAALFQQRLCPHLDPSLGVVLVDGGEGGRGKPKPKLGSVGLGGQRRARAGDGGE